MHLSRRSLQVLRNLKINVFTHTIFRIDPWRSALDHCPVCNVLIFRGIHSSIYLCNEYGKLSQNNISTSTHNAPQQSGAPPAKPSCSFFTVIWRFYIVLLLPNRCAVMCLIVMFHFNYSSCIWLFLFSPYNLSRSCLVESEVLETTAPVSFAVKENLTTLT